MSNINSVWSRKIASTATALITVREERKEKGDTGNKVFVKIYANRRNGKNSTSLVVVDASPTHSLSTVLGCASVGLGWVGFGSVDGSRYMNGTGG